MNKQKERSLIRRFWGAFNYWRKKHWQFRLTVLLLMLSVFIYENLIYKEPIINGLVRIACRAIEYSSTPRVVNAWMYYNRSYEKQRLQLSLSKIKNQLSPVTLEQLKRKPSKADLTILFNAAKKHGLLPHGADLRKMRHAMLASAIYETERRFRPEWKGVHKDIDNAKSWDFSSSDTWMRGLNYMFYQLIIYFLPPPFMTTVTWMLICLASGFLTYAYVPKYKKCAGVLVAVLITIFLLLCNRASNTHLSYITSIMGDSQRGNKYNIFTNYFFYYQFFYCMAISLIGSGLAEKYLIQRSRRRIAFFSTLISGVIIILASQFITVTGAETGWWWYYRVFNYKLTINCKHMRELPYVVFFAGGNIIIFGLYFFLIRKERGLRTGD